MFSETFYSEKERDAFKDSIRNGCSFAGEMKTNGESCTLFVENADGNVFLQEVTEETGIYFVDELYQSDSVWIDKERIPEVIRLLTKIYESEND